MLLLLNRGLDVHGFVQLGASTTATNTLLWMRGAGRGSGVVWSLGL